MIKCRPDEKPCCDYCEYCEHEDIDWFDDGKPLYCTIHKDNKHMRIVQGLGYCNDFHCIRAR